MENSSSRSVETKAAELEKRINAKIDELQEALSSRESLVKSLKNEQLKDQFEQLAKEFVFTTDTISAMAQKNVGQSEARNRVRERLEIAKERLKEEEETKKQLDSQISDLRQILLNSGHDQDLKTEFEIRIKTVENILQENKQNNDETRDKITKYFDNKPAFQSNSNLNDSNWNHIVGSTTVEAEKERLKQEESRLMKQSQNNRSIVQNSE